MYAVFLRELKSYFGSVMAWALMAAFLLISGYLIAFSLEDYAQFSMSAMQGMQSPNINEMLVQPLLSTWGFLLLFFMPLLTMRLFAEERRSGTLDLLLTYPITEAQIIFGKLFAAMVVVLMMLALTLCGFIIMGRLTPIDWMGITTGYLGLILLAATFISLGMWASSLSGSQLVAASITYGSLLILWVLSAVDRMGWFKERVGDLSALNHLNNMTRGVIDTQDVVYYVALSALFLFLTARVLESRKWRG